MRAVRWNAFIFLIVCRQRQKPLVYGVERDCRRVPDGTLQLRQQTTGMDGGANEPRSTSEMINLVEYAILTDEHRG